MGVLRSYAGPVVFAGLLVTIPLVFVMIGALVWLPGVLAYEIWRATRPGSSQNALRRFGVVVGVIVFASWLPVKYLDRTHVFPETTAPILVTAIGRHVSSPYAFAAWEAPREDTRRIHLPAHPVSLRTLAEHLRGQGLEVRFEGCVNGASILLGGWVGEMVVHDPKTGQRWWFSKRPIDDDRGVLPIRS